LVEMDEVTMQHRFALEAVTSREVMGLIERDGSCCVEIPEVVGLLGI